MYQIARLDWGRLGGEIEADGLTSPPKYFVELKGGAHTRMLMSANSFNG